MAVAHDCVSAGSWAAPTTPAAQGKAPNTGLQVPQRRQGLPLVAALSAAGVRAVPQLKPAPAAAAAGAGPQGGVWCTT